VQEIHKLQHEILQLKIPVWWIFKINTF